MINSKLIIFLIILIFFIINKQLFNSILKSITKKEKIPKHIELFHKKLEKRKYKRFFSNFHTFSWFILIIFLIILFYPQNINLNTICEYETISGKTPFNCNKYIDEVSKNITLIHSNEIIINEQNELKITLFGKYNDTKTKEIENKIREFNKLNPNKISYSFVAVINDELTKTSNCIYFTEPEKFWIFHTLAIDHINLNQNKIQELLELSKINQSLLGNCLAGKLPEEQFKKTQNLIDETNVEIIPTIFIGEKIFVSEFSFNEYYQKK